MRAKSLVCLLLAHVMSCPAASADPAPSAADSTRAVAPANDESGARDTTRVHPRIVREFPPVEVRALLHDMRSSQTVHLIPGSVLRSFPVDGLADVVALQPGVVIQGEEMHVRGGRAGETAVSLDGLSLNEPLRRRALEVPLLALRSAELVSGAPEAQYGGALAGVLNMRSADPTERPAAEWRWTSDGRTGTHYDRVSARVTNPLPAFGLGLVTAGDAMLDDTWMPMLRSERRHEIAGTSWGWRAENRLFGYAKLAPVRQPERFSAQVLVGRQIHQPYNPSFSLDGWVLVPANLKVSPTFSPESLPGYQRYRAADHLAMTDDHQLVALLKASRASPARRLTASLGWLRTRTLTSIGDHHEPVTATHRPRYGSGLDRDLFYVYWGDDPLYRESGGDVVTLRGDAELTKRNGSVTTGAGLTYEDVTMLEMDWMPISTRAIDPGLPVPVDSIRSYHATAPGGFAYAQGRWTSGGLIMNGGLRLEYFAPGAQATDQTLPGSTRGVWSLAPRLGIAYPISVKDAFSFAYVRVYQAPGRDFLYDRRTAISDRQPLGNPAIQPSVLISYEASVKHVFNLAWALQTSAFYRDVYNQIGAEDAAIPDGPINLRYDDDDQSHALGFELSLIHARGERRRLEAHYGWLHAWGNESRPEGDPYGPIRTPRIHPTGDQPLSWDRRHTFIVSGMWSWRERWSASWSSSLMSPLPWTPKPFREPLTDLTTVNSRRLDWMENTNVNVEWTPPRGHGLTLGLEARNLFDHRGQLSATLDGYPNPAINTVYDDYGAYRTETGLDGGAYWSHLTNRWIPVNDRRLYNAPRELRASVGARW